MAHPSLRQRGFSLLETMVALALMAVVTSVVGKSFLDSSRAYSSLTKLTYATTRAQIVLDRLIQELITGNFTSLDPPVPTGSTAITFEKIVNVINGSPVFGNPFHVELVPLESDATDGRDNNANGLVDEEGIRVWEDLLPHGSSPGAEDVVTVLHSKVTRGGLTFTRQGSIILIDLTVQEVLLRGEAPRTIRLVSGVKMRNG